ncbi:MAG TPA: histidinol-phosphate transaminase [Solirubrobacterales bacterium]|jgi:histidinol-phosphate aminotransferase|nr:histidinol-phosphate transaminase [Solirubrobacterales bacterium]HNE77179.1 histidinol-phosphate transaminase [Solirubrobacterales bacterium]
MTVRFNSHLTSIPGYSPGVPKGHSAEDVASSNLAQLASNESPFAPLPEVVEAITRAAKAMNRYPDPAATRLRQRLADRHEIEPGQVSVANGSCEFLLAAAEALLEPGAEIVYAWPSFSMYPNMAAMTGAREIRVPLKEDQTHDLEAMLAGITAATQIVIVCNPNNPTGTYIPFAEIADFVERVPDHVQIILDEAYIEFQVYDDPANSIDLLKRHPNLVLLRTFSKTHSLAGLRVGYALGSPAFKAAVEAVRQPFSVNALAQAAAVEALEHGDVIQRQIETQIAERVRVESGVADLGLRATDSQANFSWISLGDNGAEIEDAVVGSLAEAEIVVRAGKLLGGPGWLRVSYGTPEENDRFVAALGEAIKAHG